jgi:hypothetical protein
MLTFLSYIYTLTQLNQLISWFGTVFEERERERELQPNLLRQSIRVHKQ